MKVVLFSVLLFFDSSFSIYKGLDEDESENNSFRMYNGIASMKFLYTVKIFGRENQNTLSGFSCSGSIVHHSWIMTAAHCFQENLQVFDVFIGNVTNDVNHVIRAVKIVVHPNYTLEPEISNDLALMKLKRSLYSVNSNSKLTFDYQ